MLVKSSDRAKIAAMSEIYGMPGHLIRRLQQLSSSIFSARMKQIGVQITSPQFAAMCILDENPGVDQATLAGLIAHDRPTIGGVVDRLEKKGLVARSMNPDDRRARLLALTPAGQALLGQLRPVVDQMQVELLPGLDEAERAEFLRLATKVITAGNKLSRAPLTLPRRMGPR